MSQGPEQHEISGGKAEAQPALDSRYGQIGISAVAAAARYQGTAKNPAYAPTPYDWRLKYAEELA
jgi:ribosomal protein L11